MRSPVSTSSGAARVLSRIDYLVGCGDGCASLRQHRGDHRERIVNVLYLDSVMRNRAEPWRIAEISGDTKALLGARLRERAGIHPRRVDLERDDVRDDTIGVDPDPTDRGQPFGEGFRVPVIVDESIAHLLEPDQGSSGDDAGLSHRAAEELSHAARLGDGLGGAAEDRADGCRETL